jgi:4,5-DOPA dioxygenase extradiol
MRMPAIFFGHGNPMNALEDNAYTKAWREIGRALPKPKAVVAISAHWYLPATLVTAMQHPRTIHDFGGFPKELYQVQYPAQGDLQLASRLTGLLGAGEDHQWGLDHGTWSVLCHVYPDADVPVVQVSIDEAQAPRFHYDLGRRLAPLRDEGILIVGSGNLVHNLHAYAWGRHPAEPFDWALRFERQARSVLLAGNDEMLIEYEALGRDAVLSVPTPDHYLPLLYVMGARQKDDRVTFPIEGIDGGSVSMLSVLIG